MEDFQAWQAYPHMRMWFNKLHLSEHLGYACGPGGVPPSKSGYYCVRPTYNINGMGVGARKQWIEAGDTSGVEPGYFWCEWFDGDQYSITYEVEDLFALKQKSCFQGERDESNLYRFKRWVRSDKVFTPPPSLEEVFALSGVDVVNVEIINDKIIEIHLRDTPDPDYDELIPIWSDEVYLVDIYKKIGYTWIEATDDSDGLLPIYRLGFMVK